MNGVYLDFDAYNMQLRIKMFDENSILEKDYIFQMEYMFLMDKEIYSFEDEKVYLEYFFAYSLDYESNHYLNGEVFNLKTMKEKNILYMLDNMFIVKDELTRTILSTEREFQQFYYLLEDNIDSDFQGSLRLAKYF